MEILLLLCVFVSLCVSHRQHTGDRRTDPFLCSVPGKENCIFFNMFHIRRARVVSIGCGVWPRGCPASGSVTIQAAVISGARRSGFITLSRGLEPFHLTTLQFVSHVSARNSLVAACLSHICSCLASCVLPPAVRRLLEFTISRLRP